MDMGIHVLSLNTPTASVLMNIEFSLTVIVALCVAIPRPVWNSDRSRG